MILTRHNKYANCFIRLIIIEGVLGCFMIIHGAPSITWQSLEQGKHVSIAIVGSSWATPQISNWPMVFSDSLSRHFPGLASIDNRSVPGKQFEWMLNGLNESLQKTPLPNAIILEFHPVEFKPTSIENFHDTLSYFENNLRDALYKAHRRAPGTELFLWVPYRLCKNHATAMQSSLTHRVIAVAHDESVRIIDIWNLFEHICKEPCCPEYTQYLYDGSHASLQAGRFIAQAALLVFQGKSPDQTPPIFNQRRLP